MKTVQQHLLRKMLQTKVIVSFVADHTILKEDALLKKRNALIVKKRDIFQELVVQEKLKEAQRQRVIQSCRRLLPTYLLVCKLLLCPLVSMNYLLMR